MGKCIMNFIESIMINMNSSMTSSTNTGELVKPYINVLSGKNHLSLSDIFHADLPGLFTGLKASLRLKYPMYMLSSS